MKRRLLFLCNMLCFMLSLSALGLSFLFGAGVNYLGRYGGPWAYLYPGVLHVAILQTYPNIIVEQGFHVKAPRLKQQIQLAAIPWIPSASKNASGTIGIVLPLWIPSVAFGALCIVLWPRSMIQANRCSRCGHDVSGIPSLRCPECGSPINNPPACASSTSPPA